jgi:hypothetical protein
MLTMQKEIVVSLSELRRVSVSCTNCKTQIVLDLHEKSEHAKKYGLGVPAECPGCRKTFDDTLNAGLRELQSAYDALLPLEGRMRFRIEAPKEK